MKHLALLAIVLSWRAVVAPAQEARTQVAGTVRSAITGETLAGAAVTLIAGNGKQQISGRTTTGLHGNFAISGLAPGQYQVSIGKVGYQTFQTKAPVNIARADSTAVADLAVSLWPNGAVSGHIVDWEGHAVVEAEVRAYAVVFEPNGATLSPVTQGRTDELGEYRLVNLPEGKYLLRVSPSRKPNAGGKSYIDAPVAYYPSAVVPSQAVPIELNWGTEFTSADVRIPPDPTYTIAGVVWDAGAEGPCTRCALQVIQHDGIYRVSLPQTARVSSDGTFILRGLTSGDYSLVASRGSFGMTQTQISIRDSNVEDTRLTLGLQYAVRGEIILENPTEGIDVTDWSPQVSPVGLPVGWPQEQAEVSADRQFTIPEVPPARYRFEVRGLPPGAYLKALQGGQLLPNSEVVISPDTAFSRLQPVVAFDAATLSGKVRSPENQAPVQARIVVLPQSGQTGYQRPTSAETSLDGSFSIASLAPGSYTVYALPASSSLQIFDPSLQATLSRYARQVDLDPKQTLNVEIYLTPQLPW